MKVGFTGTREGMTEPQSCRVADLLEHFRSDIFEAEFRHGDCIGADAEAAMIAGNLGYTLYAHPADMPNYRSNVISHFYRIPENPLKRNRDIVREVDVMIAAPRQGVEPASIRGSGTWFTINHCRKQNIKRKLVIVWPDGGVTWENEGD